jgi:hypothetical protein
MKTATRFFSFSAAVLIGHTLLTSTAHAQTAPLTNSVAPLGISAYLFNGLTNRNPTLTLQRGVTYVFNVNASGHPFDIKTNSTTGATDRYNEGVTGQGAQISALTFSVPMDAPTQLLYHCEIHPAMVGFLNIVNASTASPPIVQILSLDLSPTGVTILSTGTNNWSAIPEFSPDVSVSNWTAVPTFTNVFANGTNTTTFNRLEPICGPNVFLRIRNQSN